jgi:uncharacterized protein YutE (UPF0331/DUF86 family)
MRKYAKNSKKLSPKNERTTVEAYAQVAIAGCLDTCMSACISKGDGYAPTGFVNKNAAAEA